MAHLPPSEPLGLFNQFVARQDESIVLKERVMSFSGDSFSINTTSGKPLMQVQRKTFSMGGRKMLTDMGGNHIFTLRKKAFSLGTGTFYAEDPQGNKVFELKGRFSGMKRMNTETLVSQLVERQCLRVKMYANLKTRSPAKNQRPS
jgi:uncharacterized protein YxjI